MKISRTIKGVNGEEISVQFALSDAELQTAYLEAQLLKDMDDIEVCYEGVLSKKQLKIAAQIKRYIQDSEDGIGWREAVEEAINQCGLRDLIKAYERRA